MSILDIYKEKNEDQNWFKKHTSLGKDAFGRMFEYTTTNYRTQETFLKNFKIFTEVENVPRELWPKSESHGQEEHKQHVIPMTQSKLFKKTADDLYTRTAKGKIYGQFAEKKLSKDEKWFFNYLFLLNGYYTNQKNYIIYRVKEELRGYLLSIDGVTEELLIEWAKQIITTKTLAEALRCPFFFMHSFYDDFEFVAKYIHSSEEEKEELAKYIEDNHGAKKTTSCCIAKKYEKSGNFNQSMLLDETKVFLLTFLFIRSKNPNLINLAEVFVGNYHVNIAAIDREEVKLYLEENMDVIGPIFSEILELEDVDGDFVEVESVDSSYIKKDIQDVPEDYIDETSEEGKQKIKALYNLRKKQAKIESEYKCILEDVNECRYFTAKATGKNYIELHHLIPREFRNDFAYSIEVPANYITLCPHCHRQIHLACDRERKHLINTLFNQRKGRLEMVGLGMDLVKIHSYYKISE